MKTKKTKKIIASFLICFALVSILSPYSLAVSPYNLGNISAAENYMPIAPLWTNTLDASTNLTFSGRTATATGRITAVSGSTIDATLTLYRISGGSRVFVTSWSRSSSAVAVVTFSETHTVSQAGTYVVVMRATVTRNGVTDNITLESRQIVVN